MTRRLTKPFMAAVITALLATTALADVAITLRTVARVDAGTQLTISDVTSITGRTGIASIPLEYDTSKPGRFTVGLEEVREALLTHGLSRADATIRGDTCTVIIRSTTPNTPTADPQPAITPAEPATTGRTVRDHVRASIERSLGVSSDALRLQFGDAEPTALNRATAGLTVDVHATGLGRRTPIRVTLYHADGTIEVLRMRVGVQILREVARVSRTLPRGASIQPSDFAVSNEWLSPDEPHLEPAAATGQHLRRTINAGDRLTDASVEPPVVIQRGDIVMVHVVSGAVVLRQESRALESGRVGQRIRLEPIAGGRSFRAAIEGPGRAVIVTAPPLSLEDA